MRTLGDPCQELTRSSTAGGRWAGQMTIENRKQPPNVDRWTRFQGRETDHVRCVRSLSSQWESRQTSSSYDSTHAMDQTCRPHSMEVAWARFSPRMALGGRSGRARRRHAPDIVKPSLDDNCTIRPRGYFPILSRRWYLENALVGPRYEGTADPRNEHCRLAN